jgi:hypothetical protein
MSSTIVLEAAADALVDPLAEKIAKGGTTPET